MPSPTDMPPTLPAASSPPDKKPVIMTLPPPPPRPGEPASDALALPTLNVISDFIRGAEGRWATAVAAMTALSGFGTGVWTFFQRSPEVAIGALAILLASIGMLLLQGLRRRRLAAPPQQGWFVGLRPLREADIVNGRMLVERSRQDGAVDSADKSDCDRFLEKLTTATTRGVLLSGERGCGKTSLLTAARIALRDTYLCVCLPSGVDLTSALGEQLRVEIKRLGGNELAKDSPLINLLAELRQHTQRPIVFIFDQFEEIFTTWVQLAMPAQSDKDQRLRDWQQFSSELLGLRTLLLDVLLATEGASTKCVLCVQRQFVGETESFLIDGQHPASLRSTETVGERAPSRPNLERMYIEPPTLDEVQEMLLSVQRPPWSEDLIRRVLSELAGGSLIKADQISASLAELQLIGQMLQTLHIYEAKRYPGRYRLLQEYLARLTRASSEVLPSDMREILTGLLPGPNDRAAPLVTLQALTQRTRANERAVQNALDELREKYALIEHFSQPQKDGSRIESYRLLASTVVPLLREAIGRPAEAEQRTDQLVSAALAQQLVRKGYVLPPSDLWWIWRHPPLDNRPGLDELLLRSALWFFGLWLGLGSLLVSGLLVTHFGLYRMDLDAKRQLVFKRGLPYLMPLLGSDEVHVATGFYVQDWMDRDIFPTGRELIEDARKHHIYPQFLSFYSPRFDAQRDLNQRAARMSYEYMEFRKNTPDYVGSSEVDPSLLRWRLTIETDPKQRTSTCDEYIGLINNAYKVMRTACDSSDGRYGMSCDLARTRFNTFRVLIRSELSSANLKEFACRGFDFVDTLQKQFLSSPTEQPFILKYLDWNVIDTIIERRETKANLLLDRLTKVLSAKDSWADMTWEEANDLLLSLHRLYGLVNNTGVDRFTMNDALQLVRERVKDAQMDKLQQLILYIYASGELHHIKHGEHDTRALVDDGDWVDSAVVLLGPKNPKLLALLERQINNAASTSPSINPTATPPVANPAPLMPSTPTAPAAPTAAPTTSPSAPSSPTTTTTAPNLAVPPAVTAPSAPTSATTAITTVTPTQPSPVTAAPAAPAATAPSTTSATTTTTLTATTTTTVTAPPSDPKAAPAGAAVDAKQPPSKQNDPRRMLLDALEVAGKKADEKTTARAVRILFELQRYFTGDDKPIDSELIMKGLMWLLHRGSQGFLTSDGKLADGQHSFEIDITLNVIRQTIGSSRMDSDAWIKTNQDYFFRRELLDFSEHFFQTRINNPSATRSSITSVDRASMRMLIASLLRASVPMSLLLDRLSSRPDIPVERNDQERLLLDILEVAVTDYDGQIRFEGKPEIVLTRLRPLINRYINEKDSDTPRWGALALFYSVTDRSFAEAFDEMEPIPRLSRAYALRRLLRNTDGFTQSDELHHQLPDEKTVEAALSVEHPLDASDRLFSELYSDRATRQASYREAVTAALMLLVRSPRSSELRASLMKQVQLSLASDKLPFHLRQAMWQIRQELLN